MAHSHRITPESSKRPAAKKAPAKSRASYPLKTPDPLLPLLDPSNPVEFSHGRIAGKLYGQLAQPRSRKVHPTDFYVEWPANSGDFRAINIRKVVGICGEVTAHKVFAREAAAKLLSIAKPGFAFEKLLELSRP